MDLNKDLVELLKEQCNEEKEEDEKGGLLFTIFEELRELLSKYNDTLRGSCSVCLEPFAEDENDLADGKFTDRKDLVRIDQCFHRFHLLCVYRYWFMRRHIETDEFGNKIEYKIPEVKKCPVCRRDVDEADINHITQTFKSSPDF